MTRTFVYTPPFLKAWERMGLHDEHLQLLEAALLRDPKLGDVIEGGSGARKIRIRLGEHGKRGGGRVIYLDVLEKKNLHFLLAYPKNVQKDLTPAQKKAIRAMVAAIKEE